MTLVLLFSSADQGKPGTCWSPRTARDTVLLITQNGLLICAVMLYELLEFRNFSTNPPASNESPPQKIQIKKQFSHDTDHFGQQRPIGGTQLEWLELQKQAIILCTGWQWYWWGRGGTNARQLSSVGQELLVCNCNSRLFEFKISCLTFATYLRISTRELLLNYSIPSVNSWGAIDRVHKPQMICDRINVELFLKISNGLQILGRRIIR